MSSIEVNLILVDGVFVSVESGIFLVVEQLCTIF